MTEPKIYTAEEAKHIKYDPNNFAAQMRFITANLLSRKPLEQDGKEALAEVVPVVQKLRKKIEKVYGEQKPPRKGKPDEMMPINQIAEFCIQMIVFDERPVELFCRPSNKWVLNKVREWVKSVRKEMAKANEQAN